MSALAADPIDLDALGLWMPFPGTRMAFDSSAGRTLDQALWSMNLPADGASARQELRARTDRLDLFNRGLLIAAKRMEALEESLERGTAGASFAAFTRADVLPQPEQELLESLGIVSPGTARFGIGDNIDEAWTLASQRFQAFVERLRYALVYYARVETNADGKLLGYTWVSWTGDMDTAWRAGLRPDQVALHWRTLALALASRNACLRTLALVSHATATLATLPTLLAAPGGALVALPLAYRFIRRVLAELEPSQIPNGR